MRKGVTLTILLAFAVTVFVWGMPKNRQSSGPIIQLSATMRQIGLKLRDYNLERAATENDDLKTKSIEDFVSLNVLTPADAAYLRDHEVKFYGYDPARIGGDIPLLEAVGTQGSYRARIVCYSDISIASSPLNRD